MAPIRYHSDQFPPQQHDYARLVSYISDAQQALGRYDGMLNAIPNRDILIAPMMNKEAESSSRIEGTQATLRQVMEYEAGIDATAKIDDIQEIINYRMALQSAIKQLAELPLSQRLIKNAHAILLDGVRGQQSNPGAFRASQNWIGPPGCDEEDALFVPCSAEDVPERISIWEKYMHSKQADELVQLAVVHAEFEAIHPFLDGNGRIGRLIVPLFLFAKDHIQSPSFYISEELEKNREGYYLALRAVSEHGHWDEWCIFFLKTIANQANSNFDKAKAILALYNECKRKITEMTNSVHAITSLDYIFTMPVFNSTQFCANVSAHIGRQGAMKILHAWRDENFVETMRAGRGPHPELFMFRPLLEIVG